MNRFLEVGWCLIWITLTFIIISIFKEIVDFLLVIKKIITEYFVESNIEKKNSYEFDDDKI